jgi:hypothetical protein
MGKKLTSVGAILATLWMLFVPYIAVVASERRCGWLENPTPANWWLSDPDGLWILSTQGSSQPTGMELIPDISRREFVSTNGHYGYTCACLDGEFNRDQNRVSRITSVQQLALLKCRQDQKLPKP